MEPVESFLPYVLTGCIFYAFGLKWCYEYAKDWNMRRTVEDRNESKMYWLVSCGQLLNSHPLEGTLKLIATAIGLVGTIAGGLPDIGVVSPKVVHATIYLFFAFSGLVDVLNFYFPHNVGEGLVKMALAQSFFVEGFLFVWANVGESPMINVILAAIVWTTSLAVMLELICLETKLLTAASTLLHGAWIAHMVRMSRIEPLLSEKVALAFSWHVAAASAVTLCIVAVTKSCTPRITIVQPQEIPIYDYCHEPDRRI